MEREPEKGEILESLEGKRVLEEDRRILAQQVGHCSSAGAGPGSEEREWAVVPEREPAAAQRRKKWTQEEHGSEALACRPVAETKLQGV